MEKKDQLLIIDPPCELKFRGPFVRPIITIMNLMNPTDRTILFKIKTTAPRKYCVRPNFGAVEPHSFTDIEICLQANFSYDPNEKNKHKFMVQSFVVPDGATDHSNLWNEIQPEQLMDSKLRCVFELPSDTPSGDFPGTAPAPSETVVKESITTQAAYDENPKDNQSEYVRVTSEVRQMREDESQLRQENLKLKEQIYLLRTTVENYKKERATPSSAQFQNPYSPPQLEQPVPVMYIAIAVAMAIFGLLLGKYLL